MQGKPSNDDDAKYYQLWLKKEETAVESEYQRDLNVSNILNGIK